MSDTHTPLFPIQLRCLGLDAPIGVEHPQPPLSWRLTGEGLSRFQTAFQLLVASSPDRLTPALADLWDSGRVHQSESTHVVYDGKPLVSRQICYWTVRVWDERDVVGEFAETATWEMGLLSEDDWSAQWITSPTYPEVMPGSRLAPSPLLRREATVAKPVRKARAYISGLGYYELQINGTKVGDNVLDPIHSKYDVRTHYVVHDITSHLAPGPVAFGVMLGTGFYNCHTAEVWDFMQAPWRDRPKALVQIEIEYADGTTDAVATDITWKTSTGPVVFDGVRNGESYDAREEKAGWANPAYDDSAWVNAMVTGHPGGVLSAQLVPCKVMATLDAVSTKEVAPGVWVADLGQNIAGWAQISASAPAGTEVTLRYGEKLKDNGEIDVSKIDIFIKSGQFQTDKYTFRGDGTETWEPRFTYHGFRYVQVSGFPGEFKPEYIKGHVVHSAFASIGDFACSDELMPKMYKAEKWTYTGNFVGIPLDCPQREKNGWTGDTQIASETGLFMFDSGPAYRKWLTDINDAMRPSGQLPGIVPTGGWGYNWGSGPSWDSVLSHIPWYLYQYYGDADVLVEHYEKMKRYVRYMSKMATGDILSFGLADWLQPLDADKRTPTELLVTGYYYANAKLVSKIARVIGRDEDIETYEALADRIKAAYNRELFDPQTGMYRGSTQTGQACALFHGLVPDEHVNRVFDALVKLIEDDDYRPRFGIIGVKYVPDVLARHGRSDVVYRMITQKQFPCYADWFDQGATTMYEDWKGEGSLNHVALGVTCEWMGKYVAGIQIVEPGYKRFAIAPNIVDELSWATARHESPYGEISSAWHRSGDVVTLDVTIPTNTTATICLPGEAISVTPPDASIAYGREFELGSGSYSIEFKA